MSPMRRSAVWMLLALVMAFSACSSSEDKEVQHLATQPAPPLPPGRGGGGGGAGGARLEPSRDEQTRAGLPRMVVKDANLDFQISDYEATLKRVQAIVEQAGGFLVSTQVTIQERNAKSGFIVLRVPAPAFDRTLQALKKLALHVGREAIQGNDITEEFYDVEARLENKRRVEERIREILRSAHTITDILEVERTLAQVREEIEHLEGRKRYLSDKVAFSTITVVLREPQYDVAMAGGTFWTKVVNGFRRGINGVGDVMGVLLTVLVAAIPIWILLFVVAWLGIRYFRKKKGRSGPAGSGTQQ